MSRSLKKAPYVEEKLFNRIVAMNEKNEKKVLKTWSRSSTIFPEFVGHTIAVSVSFPLMRSSTICTLRGEILTYLRCAFASI